MNELHLVTGGAGFIGSNLVRRLAELGARVRVFDDLSSGHLENLAGLEASVEFVRGDLRDAAELDGLGHLGFLRNVAIPVTRPIIASFALVSLLSAWNQYTWPRAVVTEGSWETIQIALKGLSARNIDQLNVGFAAAIIAAVPILILLLAFQKHLIRGLTAGAVKG